jgi:CRISPR-associated protein Cas2
MRVLVLFDLPSVEKEEKRIYSKFRKELLKDGFTMMQYSIYMRFCRNVQDANKHIEKVCKLAPKDGHIRILSITENQYEEMVVVIGELSDTEKTIKDDYLVIIE